MKILLINGPNLQLLGVREVSIYGRTTLRQIETQLSKKASESKDLKIDFFQSNCEGEIVDKIAFALKNKYDGLIINPAAYTHTSVAIYDALKAVKLPTVEVHLSNIHDREEFRRHSVTAGACIGVIAGFGAKSYEYALDALRNHILNIK